MIWADREAKRIKQRNLPLEWIDDMKTPSGRIHVGSLRGVVIHDMLYKALKEIGVNTEFSYVFNDMDPMDGLPVYLEKEKWEKYMGHPLYKIPSPVSGYKSYAHYFAQEFIEVFQSINCHPKIIWSSELYASGKMNQIRKTFLNNSKKVREIYKKIAKAKKPESWYPYNPVCQKCGKIGTTNVYKWDGVYVYYRCEYHMVDWADGCGYEAKVKPIGENGKLPWKLDWPGHWKAIGITIESSGKDHMSAGGSYDVACHLAKEILNYNPPDAFGGYEWFTVGGRKMSSSKGVGSSAKEISEILPPEILRFLIVRTPIKTHLDFNPYGETIPRLFDEYDRCLNAYFDKIEKKVPSGKQGEVILDFARIIEFSVVSNLSQKRLFLPRFKTIASLLKNHKKEDEIISFFENQKKEKLNKEEKNILEERIKYVKIYLEKYQTIDQNSNLPTGEHQPADKTQNYQLNQKQKEFLKLLAENLKKLEKEDKEKIQKIILKTINNLKISPKEAFNAFYFALIGTLYGPKAGDFIIKIGLKKSIEKLQKIFKE
ncbi:MAG: lysine--tRNA ligase [Patescibacteria group bacterium]|nr:lysine--tRNA ligase [Patescibacteria group bacterium]